MGRWAIALSAWVSLASPALAQDGATEAATVEARAHFDRGTEAFDVGQYELAAREFRAAYELTEHPDLLFNIYSALERAGQLPEAADALEGYLRDGDPDEERRTALQARLARLRERLAEARAAEAEARLEASRAERDHDEDVTAPPPPDRAPVPDGGGGVHPAGVGVLIGGGVLLANFAVFAGLAAAEDGSLSGGCSPSCSDDDVSTLQTFNLVADVSWIAGAVVVATGVVLLLALPPESSDDASAAVAPWVSPDGAGLMVAGRIR